MGYFYLKIPYWLKTMQTYYHTILEVESSKSSCWAEVEVFILGDDLCLPIFHLLKAAHNSYS